jgi:hypothetical protein
MRVGIGPKHGTATHNGSPCSGQRSTPGGKRRGIGPASALVALVFTFGAPPANAAGLPETLTPPAPFPLVLAQYAQRERVAPGVERAIYRLQTSAGPLVVSAVLLDPREPTLRLAAVLAHDSIVSSGETVSSMAARTGAVAGINADYFDIGNTNAPVGVVVRNGGLERTPSTRVALTVSRDRHIRFETYRFAGSAVDEAGIPGAARTIPLATVNEWPPASGSATLLTPAFGAAAPHAGVAVAELAPLSPPNATQPAPNGRYRVTAVDAGAPAQPGYALALGATLAGGGLPQAGDLITLSAATDPPLADVATALGGGPALVADGLPVDDPASPGYAERARRIPVSAALRFADGTCALIVVDGRRPQLSIGVDRAELIALALGFGATDAMQFDSGGSATLVARDLGDERASVQNDPSDGRERPVADGLFAYSDAPLGAPAQLVVRPAAIVALPGATLALRSAVVDAAGHPLGEAQGPWHVDGAARIDADDVLHVGDALGTHLLALERDGVRATVPLTIVPTVARIAISPERPDPLPAQSLTLQATAFDPRGRPVAVGTALTWSALRGTIDPSGRFTAGPVDGFVTATIGAVKSSEIVRVGRHDEPLAAFASTERDRWHFATVPPGGPGALDVGHSGIRLSYDFTGSERAAYANLGLTIGDALALSCAIDGDGNGEGIRFAVVDRFGERDAVTLLKTVGGAGAQRVAARIPTALAPPLVLQSFYVVGSLATPPVHVAGAVTIRDCRLTQPGTPPPAS